MKHFYSTLLESSRWPVSQLQMCCKLARLKVLLGPDRGSGSLFTSKFAGPQSGGSGGGLSLFPTTVPNEQLGP